MFSLMNRTLTPNPAAVAVYTEMEVLHVNGFLGVQDILSQQVELLLSGNDDFRLGERYGWSAASRQKHRQRLETLFHTHGETVGEKKPAQLLCIFRLHSRS